MASARSQRQPTLPTDLANEIEAILETHPWLGYSSLSAFATEASRQLLRDTLRQIHERNAIVQGHKPSPRKGRDSPPGE